MSDLGANYNNKAIDDIKREAIADRDRLRAEVYSDNGLPPGADRLAPHEQLAKLNAMRAAGDPRAMSREAQRAEERLKAQIRAKGGQ